MKKDINDFDSLLQDLTATIQKTSRIDDSLWEKYHVKRGLRNEDHSGVLVGLTNIGNVVGYHREEGKIIPRDGELYYRGYNIHHIVEGFQKDERHGFEETVFLLLSGRLPMKPVLDRFTELLATQRELDPNIKMSILDFKGVDIMNVLARTVMVMYARDLEADVITRENLIVQSLKLIASFPTIISYAYHSM